MLVVIVVDGGNRPLVVIC